MAVRGLPHPEGTFGQSQIISNFTILKSPFDHQFLVLGLRGFFGKPGPGIQKKMQVRPSGMKTLLHGQTYKKIGLADQFFKRRTSKEHIKFITIVSILVFSTSSYTQIQILCIQSSVFLSLV